MKIFFLTFFYILCNLCDISAIVAFFIRLFTIPKFYSFFYCRLFLFLSLKGGISALNIAYLLSMIIYRRLIELLPFASAFLFFLLFFPFRLSR